MLRATALCRLVVASIRPLILNRAISTAQILTRRPDLSIHHRSSPRRLPSCRGYARDLSTPFRSEEEKEKEEDDDDDDDKEEEDLEDMDGKGFDSEEDIIGFMIDFGADSEVNDEGSAKDSD